MLSWRRNHSCDTVSSRDVLSNSGENKGLCDVIPGPNFVSSTKRRKPNRIGAFVRKTLPPKTSSRNFRSHAFASRQMCSCFVTSTSARCASVQLVSEWVRQRVAVGRQTTAVVESCDTPERLQLITSLHFLRGSDTAHLIDAGSTVARLVHSQELLDPLKLALVHENRPIAELCLGGDSPHFRKLRSRPTTVG